MQRKQLFRIISGILILMALTPAAFAVKYKILGASTGGKLPTSPNAGVVMDTSGNLYGTAMYGGASGYGAVFELIHNSNGGWQGKVLHSFTGNDGAYPQGALIVDSNGSLYGTTWAGGQGDCNGYRCGVVFELTPSPQGAWTMNVLHYFTGDVGVSPVGSLMFDAAGNLYGTTSDWSSGFTGPGTVFKLTPSGDGTWTESIIYTFTGPDGYNPNSGLVADPQGNLYSETDDGGADGQGVIFQMAPQLDGTWAESVIYSFQGGADGWRPQVEPILDSAGNLYGITVFGGAGGSGTVWKLAPNVGGGWTKSTLYTFQGGDGGSNPWASLALDTAGNLYGTTDEAGADGCGVVFRLSPTPSGPWKETVIHAFSNPPECGSFGGLMFDASGNLFGTTVGDSRSSFGSVFEIMP